MSAKRRLVIFQDGSEMLRRPDTVRHIVNLPDPVTGRARKYVIADGVLFELQKVQPSTRCSWFIDQQVVSDGSCLLATPVNPAFFLLRLLGGSTASAAGSSSSSSKHAVFSSAHTLLEAAASAHDARAGAEGGGLSVPRVVASLNGLPAALANLCDVRVASDADAGAGGGGDASASAPASSTSAAASASASAASAPAPAAASDASASTLYRFSPERAVTYLSHAAVRVGRALQQQAALATARHTSGASGTFVTRSVAQVAPEAAEAAATAGGGSSAETTTSSSSSSFSSSSAVAAQLSSAAPPLPTLTLAVAAAAVPRAQLLEALGILGDYVDGSWCDRVAAKLGLAAGEEAPVAASSPASAASGAAAAAAAAAAASRPSNAAEDGDEEPLGIEHEEASPSSSSASASATSPSLSGDATGFKRKTPPKASPMSLNAKRLAAASTKGMKSIASMFGVGGGGGGGGAK